MWGLATERWPRLGPSRAPWRCRRLLSVAACCPTCQKLAAAGMRGPLAEKKAKAEDDDEWEGEDEGLTPQQASRERMRASCGSPPVPLWSTLR